MVDGAYILSTIKMKKGFCMTKYLNLSFLLVFSFLHASENNERLREKWAIGDFFNNSTISLLKVFIKEMYSVEQPIDDIVVQTDVSLCREEKRFLQNRIPIIQHNLKEFFHIDKPLRIGFCCSGGGNRAMIGTLGLLTGAAKSHILDTTLYIAGLSGSTWLISQLCYLAATTYKKKSFENILADIKASYSVMLHDYSMLHIHGVYAPPLISFESTDDVCIEIAKRFAYGQPMTLVNLFGALVSDYALSLMGNDRLSEKWSRIIPEVQKGKVPLPLCAAAFEKEEKQYGWFEMSPLQCGSKDLGYIPVPYLGSSFSYGKINLNGLCPEYPVSFYLGMYGSKFAITVQEIAQIQKDLQRNVSLLKEYQGPELPQRNILENYFIQGIIQGKIQELIFSSNALTYAHFPNYSKGVKKSVLKNNDCLWLFDAGFAFNLPLPLLIDRPERNLDIIFLYGSFPGQKGALKALETYCFQSNVPFPDLSIVSDETLQEVDMTILNHPANENYKAEMPTYIYFPTNGINWHAPPYISLNFKYTAQEVDFLSNKMEQVFLNNIDKIEEVLQLVAQKRYV